MPTSPGPAPRMPVLTAAVLALAGGAAACAQPMFHITEIPLLPGTTSSHAQAVNNLGQVVGYARASNNDCRAFLFDPATGVLTTIGQLTNLGAGGDTAGPKSINDSGEVVGTFIQTPSGRPHAFYWHGGPMIDITTPRPDGQIVSAEARGISPGGLIVGLNELACGSPTPFARPAYWTDPASRAQVADLPGQCGSGFPMMAINASGAMVGREYILVDGFTWGRPTVTNLPLTKVMLPTFDGTFEGHGKAWGINAAGIVCGSSEDRSGGGAHACFWTGTTITTLNGLFGHGAFDEARAINDGGDIVGMSYDGAFRAVIWPGLSPTASNLQTLITNATALTLSSADGISTTGFIAANADTVGPNARGVLLAPCTPAFLAAPAPVTVGPGGTASFTATAVGAGPIAFAWTRGGVPVSDGPTGSGSVISGATTGTLTITGVGAADAGDYAATATTPCGNATSPAATLTICPAEFNGDGFLDFFDYDDYVRCFESGACPPGTTADFNGDGFADFFDYDDFVAAFQAGC